MNFSQKFSIRKNNTVQEFMKGIYSPTLADWRPVIEDYLYISEKRTFEKWSNFKLQQNIFTDIVLNIKAIDGYKELQNGMELDFKKRNISDIDFKRQKEHNQSEIASLKIINKVLREIVDGMVWRLFNYNRPILSMLADKQPIEIIRPEKGTINNLFELADTFLKHNSIAILNDITNFLRVGDVTRINSNGDIEIVEVKSSKMKNPRIARQKRNMSELVEFFNTGLANFDGKKTRIRYSNSKQKTYLKLLNNSIKMARYKGYESLCIGNHLILEIVDCAKIDLSSEFSDFFQTRHQSIKKEWKQKKDVVSIRFLTDKMNYSKNCAPFSIYPFDLGTRVDIMTGRLMIKTRFNYSEILRIIEKAGWKIVNTIFDNLENRNSSQHSPVTISKGSLTYGIPWSFFSRMRFELWSPFSLVAELEKFFKQPFKETNFDQYLTHYIDDEKIWR